MASNRVRNAQRSLFMVSVQRSGPNATRGVLVGLGFTVLVVGSMAPARLHVGSAAPALLLTLGVGLGALVGGARAVMVLSLVCAAVLDLVFVHPYGTLSILRLEGVSAVVTFLVVAGTGGMLMAREGDRRRDAEARERELRDLALRLEEMHRGNVVLSERAAQADVLARVDDQRSALLRSVSHDLRTPLSAIRAVVTDLRSDVVHDPHTQTELLTLVSDEVDRLDRLVANLLSMSRIEAGVSEPDRQAVDLEELLSDRVRQLAPLFTELRVRTSIPSDLPLVDADYPQLEQVVTNLLANAARHAPPDTDVWLVARREDDAFVRVEVSDRGLGVSDDESTRIFEPFQRGPGSGSTGIGLAICKAIVEAHGGRIWVERTFGGGATFSFTLPVHTGRAPS